MMTQMQVYGEGEKLLKIRCNLNIRISLEPRSNASVLCLFDQVAFGH